MTKKNLIVSTIGTSILTNVIDRSNGKSEFEEIRIAANLRPQAATETLKEIAGTLNTRARKRIEEVGAGDLHRVSAEINGILAAYAGALPAASRDHHVLVTTDTYLGIMAAEIIKDFLTSNKISAEILVPSGLSTASNDDFSGGMDELLTWMDSTLSNYRASGYKVIFNLVGAFKVLQGYMTTLGMFHADEMLYVFEGSSEPIRIPRLPVRIDDALLAPATVPLALMSAGFDQPISDLVDVPEALLMVSDGRALLSSWGKFVWERARTELLGGEELLAWPRLSYSDSFRRDFKAYRDSPDRARAQAMLARAAGLLEQGNGDLSILRADGGLLYKNYHSREENGHFRISQGDRVSCVPVPGGLELRHIGTHDNVNDNP